MKTICAALLASLTVFALPAAAERGSAQAQEAPETASSLIDASDPAAIAGLMRRSGFAAEVQSQPNGAVQIQSSLGSTGFWLYFQACEPDFTDCEIITLSSGFDFETPQVRDLLGNWNETHYSKAYLDPAGDPFIEFYINMLHGVSEENFINTLSWFTTELTSFLYRIGWNSGQDGKATPI